MPKFRKKPVVVEAVQIAFGMQAPAWLAEALQEGAIQPAEVGDGIVIHTLEGNMSAVMGDWIIQGVKGELYSCKPEIFAEIYEAVGSAA